VPPLDATLVARLIKDLQGEPLALAAVRAKPADGGIREVPGYYAGGLGRALYR
jgi:hypothetical protein